MEFRGLPPAAQDQLEKAVGDKLAVQTSDWNCGNMVTFNHQRKPFDDVRVRRAMALAIDQWRGAPALSKVANVRTVGGLAFPGSPLAATKEELQKIAGFWPDIEKSRAEARRLLKEAGAEGLSFELLNRDIDQPYKYYGLWVIDQWSKIGLNVTQRVLTTGPWFQALRDGSFTLSTEGNCQNIVNPLADVSKYLPGSVAKSNYGYFEDPQEAELYERMVGELDKSKQRDLMRQFEKRVLSDEVHSIYLLWWQRIVPYRSYVKGWKIGPSHYVNQDLSTIWLDK
jgi:peptide/nickel transport system substrate-binding protein